MVARCIEFKPILHDCGGVADVRIATPQTPVQFRGSGLDNLYLAGVQYIDCPKCGKQVDIPAIDKLMCAVARMIVQKPCLLTGAEIRFLRKQLGKKSADFAQIIGVRPEEVSRWENDVNRPEKSACRVIRLTYAQLTRDKELQSAIGDPSKFERWMMSLGESSDVGKILATYQRKCWHAESQPSAELECSAV